MNPPEGRPRAHGPPASLGGTGQVVLACPDLAAALPFFVDRLGFKVEMVFPADAPSVATLMGHGLRLRLEPGSGDPGLIRLPSQGLNLLDPSPLRAPNGTRIELVDQDPGVFLPPLAPEFLIVRPEAGPPPGEGRAGMIYRDLIPGRLGGRFIASHIALPRAVRSATGCISTRSGSR